MTLSCGIALRAAALEHYASDLFNRSIELILGARCRSRVGARTNAYEAKARRAKTIAVALRHRVRTKRTRRLV